MVEGTLFFAAGPALSGILFYPRSEEILASINEAYKHQPFRAISIPRFKTFV
jgi:hypothetical protein